MCTLQILSSCTHTGEAAVLIKEKVTNRNRCTQEPLQFPLFCRKDAVQLSAAGCSGTGKNTTLHKSVAHNIQGKHRSTPQDKTHGSTTECGATTILASCTQTIKGSACSGTMCNENRCGCRSHAGRSIAAWCSRVSNPFD